MDYGVITDTPKRQQGASNEAVEMSTSYPDPTSSFVPVAGHIAFYSDPFEECLVDGEQVVPQPGGFYGGWITSREAGPFKGVPGSRFW